MNPTTPARGLITSVLILAACTSTGTSSYPDRVTLPSLDEPYRLPAESCGNFFVAPVMLNGSGPYDFLLDSGAGRTVISPEVIREADLGRRIDQLSIGEFDAFEVGYGRLDMRELSAALGRRVYGILGHPVFAGTLMTWDFPEGAIDLQVGELSAEDPGVIDTRDNVRPFVRGTVGGTERWILIDTGSSRGLTLRSPEDLPMSSPLQATGARARVDGIHVVRTGRVEGMARVGMIRVEEPVVANSVSVDLVGQEVLRLFRVTFDQRNDRIRFERADAEVDAPVGSAAVRTAGYAIRPDSAWGEVISVFSEGSPVREGDRIIEVAGTPWTARTCPTRRAGPVTDPLADTVQLVVVRDGQELTLSNPRRIVHPRAGN